MDPMLTHILWGLEVGNVLFAGRRWVEALLSVKASLWRHTSADKKSAENVMHLRWVYDFVSSEWKSFAGMLNSLFSP